MESKEEEVRKLGLEKVLIMRDPGEGFWGGQVKQEAWAQSLNIACGFYGMVMVSHASLGLSSLDMKLSKGVQVLVSFYLRADS